ncbi:MAG: hypothetical protein WCJ29_03960 [bacterium]
MTAKPRSWDEVCRLAASNHFKRIESSKALRAEYAEISKGLKEGGMSVHYMDLPKFRPDVLEVHRVMSRRSGDGKEIGIFEAARAYPTVLEIYKKRKEKRPHTILAAAVREYLYEMERTAKGGLK